MTPCDCSAAGDDTRFRRFVQRWRWPGRETGHGEKLTRTLDRAIFVPTPLMIAQISARSISRAVQEQLHRSPASHLDAHVLAVFEHACDLVTHEGDVVALVMPRAGNGPLNVVVDGPAGLFAGLEQGDPATLAGECLRVGRLRVDLGAAAVWEPRPDWDALRARRDAIVASLPLLRDLCLHVAPAGSLLSGASDGRTPGFSREIPTEVGRPPLVVPPIQDGAHADAVFAAVWRAAEALREGWQGKTERLHEGVLGLAGLGSGLTPAGDDYLTGALLWAWLAHPAPAPFCRALVEAAIPRTTLLSAAFLRAAARGECSAPWHSLLGALGQRVEAQGTGWQPALHKVVQEIMAHGATSGADTLAGFLYASEFR